jgi:LysR family transcriptional activator of nhaA
MGRAVYAYADDIFSLGQELMDVIRGHATGRPIRLHVGVSDVVPKLLTRLVLQPALRTDHPIRLVCREGKTDRLLADLALAGLDVVIADSPLDPGSKIRAFSHKLGESLVGVYGSTELAARYGRSFPGCLDGAPMLLPTENTALRRSIDAWLETRGIRPAVVAEFEDSALLKAFAESGHGLFFAPTVVGTQIAEQFGVRLAGQADGITESLFAITIDRRIRHPGITAIVEAARGKLTA